jgi:hypothetical protein
VSFSLSFCTHLKIIGDLKSRKKPYFFVPRKEPIMAKLADKSVRDLQVPEAAKDVQVFDEELPGFGIRKFASGKATFFLKSSVGEQQRRKSLGPFLPGTLNAIRKEAKVVLSQAALDKDVVGEAKKAVEEAKKASQVKTLGELVPVYLRVREFGNVFWPKLRPKSLIEATRYLEKAWLPLHCAPIDQITRKMVKDRRDEARVDQRRHVSQSRPCYTDRYRRVAHFIDAFFARFPESQKPARHPKWKETYLTTAKGLEALPGRRGMAGQQRCEPACRPNACACPGRPGRASGRAGAPVQSFHGVDQVATAALTSRGPTLEATS